MGVAHKNIDALCNKSLKRADEVITECKKRGIRILTYDSPLYPEKLKNIFDPPYVLYVRSKERLDLNKHLCVAVVGNREYTDYGRIVTENLAGDIAKEGVTIVSGMARGIDSVAHAAALNAGGKTIAVLGCGADICYPAENNNLMSAIIENGMVLSEFPPGMPPLPKNFPQRNRIISGLCLGTLVTEAAVVSGSLITANIALEQNREVYAVPGNITNKHSEGCNLLISSLGAKVVLNAENILEDFRDTYAEILENNKPIIMEEKAEELIPFNERYKDLSEKEQLILKSMSAVPVHIDEIMSKTKIPSDELVSTLTLLEISAMIKSHPGKMFSLNI